MNRSRRILANAQALGPVDSPCSVSGYESDKSSPAPSIPESWEDIDCESDAINEDPNFIPPNNITSSSDSESEDAYDFREEEKYQENPKPNPKIRILSDVKLINEPRVNYAQTSSTTDSRKKKKKTNCKFCLTDVTNFERHLERNHNDTKEVLEMMSYPKKHPERKKIISLLRNSGHFEEYLRGNLYPKYGEISKNKQYYPCSRCKALLSKTYLSRHKKKCIVFSSNTDKCNEAAMSQTLLAYSLDENSTVHKLRVRDEVFSRMKPDSISLLAKTDYLIYSFGEQYLKKHKRAQIITVCSNKMRELSRLLIEFRKVTNNLTSSFQMMLQPKYFDIVIECAKNLGGYDVTNKSFKSPSLSAHLGTSLKQVCELYMRMILKEDPSIKIENRDYTLKEVKRFKDLIESQWTVEISSLAFKVLQERQWEKPALLPLTSDIKKFRDYVTEIADKAIIVLKSNANDKKQFKNLVESCMILTILFNRRRIGDVQYTLLKSYTDYNSNNTNQLECENALTDSEKVLTQHYKRIVAGGKGSRPIAILFPPKLQDYIDFFVSIRSNIVPSSNPYLFGCPGTSKWTRGDVIIKKFAEKADLKYPQQISSNKLRKQIATVVQILNLTNDEIDQFAQFMGHTEKTHNEFYKLPQDIYQTAKVSKLLLLMEKGVDKYKGKSLREIDINPLEEYAHEEDSDSDSKSVKIPLSVELNATGAELTATASGVQEKSETSERKMPMCVGRTKWNQDQMKLLKSHFSDHIATKKPPKRQECLEIINKYPDILFNKDWVRVKTFIYNCYRLKK